MAQNNKLTLKNIDGYVIDNQNTFKTDMKIESAFSDSPLLTGVFKLKTPNLSMGNMNYNNQNYLTGRGYPTNEGINFNRNNIYNNYNNNDFNLNNNLNNNFVKFGYNNNNDELRNNFDNKYNNNYSFKNTGGFNNIMGSSYNFSSQPRGSAFTNFRSNINMNGPYN